MALNPAGARHRASRDAVLKGLLMSVLAVMMAIWAAMFFIGGSFAYWNDSVTINPGTVTSGTTQLKVNGGSTVALSGTTWSTMLPGDVVSQQVTLQNVGDVSTTVTALTTGSFGSLLVHTKKGACSTTITGTSSTVSPTTLGTFIAGESSAACIQVTLPTTALNSDQGTSQSFTVTFTGTTGT